MEGNELHPEWTFMYGKGLPFGLIAKLCKAPRSTVNLYLQDQVRRNPALQHQHDQHRPAQEMEQRRVPKAWLNHIEALKSFLAENGRWPRFNGSLGGERALAHWIAVQRRKNRDGSIGAEELQLLADIPSWDVPARAIADRLRWQQRLTDLHDFLGNEGRWPRFRGHESAEERALGIWLHGQRQKRINGLLAPGEIQALSDMAPGWDGIRHQGQ